MRRCIVRQVRGQVVQLKSDDIGQEIDSARSMEVRPQRYGVLASGQAVYRAFGEDRAWHNSCYLRRSCVARHRFAVTPSRLFMAPLARAIHFNYLERVGRPVGREVARARHAVG